MTIAIGFHLGSYVMLAADTRMTNYLFGAPIAYQDDKEKVHRTGVGLITGAGYCPLLDAVKNRFEKMGEGNTNDIIHMIQEERQSLGLQMGMSSLITNKSVATGWIFTYITESDGQYKLRMGLSHPSIGEKHFSLYGPGQCCVISPVEASQEQAKIIQDGFEELLEPLTDISDQVMLHSSITRHWNIIAGVIRNLQPQFPSISAFSQVGVHLLSGHRGISPIVSSQQQDISFQLT